MFKIKETEFGIVLFSDTPPTPDMPEGVEYEKEMELSKRVAIEMRDAISKREPVEVTNEFPHIEYHFVPAAKPTTGGICPGMVNENMIVSLKTRKNGREDMMLIEFSDAELNVLEVVLQGLNDVP